MNAAMQQSRPFALRLGGGAVMVGTLAWLILGGLHGALPGTGQEAVARPRDGLWQADRLFTVVAIAIVAAGLALLSGMLNGPASASIGHLGAMIAVPSGAVLGVGIAVEGFVLAALADAYAAAPDETMRAMHVAQADLVLTFIGGTSFAFQTLFGLGLTLLASATYLSREFPRWHCWLGLAGGSVWTVAGILAFLGARQTEYWLVDIPVVPVAIWLLGLGWLSWKRANDPADGSTMLT